MSEVRRRRMPLLSLLPPLLPLLLPLTDDEAVVAFDSLEKRPLLLPLPFELSVARRSSLFRRSSSWRDWESRSRASARWTDGGIRG